MDEHREGARRESLGEAVRRRRPPGRHQGEGGVHEVVVAGGVVVPVEPPALVRVPRQQLFGCSVYGGVKRCGMIHGQFPSRYRASPCLAGGEWGQTWGSRLRRLDRRRNVEHISMRPSTK